MSKQQQDEFFRHVDDKRRAFYDFYDSNDLDNHFSYIEAALAVAAERDIDFSDPAFKKFLTSDLKAKLRAEGEAISLIRPAEESDLTQM